MEEIVEMPKCHYQVMILEQRKRQLRHREENCKGKGCFDRCLDYACPGA